MIREKSKKRCLEVVYYFLATEATQKEIAKEFNISGKTVSLYLNDYLRKIDGTGKLYNQVQEILKQRRTVKERKNKEEKSKRILEVAKYFLETGESQKQIAEKFGISQMLVSYYLNDQLKEADSEGKIYAKVQEKLEKVRPRKMSEQEKKMLVNEVANYLLETGESQREIAKKFNISEGTISKILNHHLKIINPRLYAEVQLYKYYD